MQYAAGAGTANAQTVTLTPAPASYSSGMIVRWLPANQNTNTTPTLNVNGLGATTIVRTTGAALSVGDVSASQIAVAVYNATSGKFQLLNPQVSTAVTVSCSGAYAGMFLTTVDNSGSGAGGNCDPNLSDVSQVLNYSGTLNLTASGNGAWGVASGAASAPGGTAGEVDYTAQSNKPGFTANGGSFQLFPVGPASSTANDLVKFSNTDGATLADSGVLAANVVQGPASSTSTDLASFSGTGGKTLADTVAGNLQADGTGKFTKLAGITPAANSVAGLPVVVATYDSAETATNASIAGSPVTLYTTPSDATMHTYEIHSVLTIGTVGDSGTSPTLTQILGWTMTINGVAHTKTQAQAAFSSSGSNGTQSNSANVAADPNPALTITVNTGGTPAGNAGAIYAVLAWVYRIK
jgi:hypothetical protein